MSQRQCANAVNSPLAVKAGQSSDGFCHEAQQTLRRSCNTKGEMVRKREDESGERMCQGIMCQLHAHRRFGVAGPCYL